MSTPTCINTYCERNEGELTILLHSGKQRVKAGRKRGDCLFSMKSSSGFGFVRVTQTRLGAFFTLALVLFKKESNQLKASVRWNLREPLLITKEEKKAIKLLPFLCVIWLRSLTQKYWKVQNRSKIIIFLQFINCRCWTSFQF